ncbi:hypothetical protein LAV_00052 [Sphingobium phage Lacusarx]|uniref:Lipoprotein n=1 Tax=Sphingobium phage Lacusarx TaxID=1980139 RepID=A0A1W6DXF8_9CAUD|nr:hypothetical protein FDH44_gp052 [Sphingobium phage Lacusarx]ARK07452.1 hypothetical protein LAV_00052 [Sphingobium phage Lacusarx]
MKKIMTAGVLLAAAMLSACFSDPVEAKRAAEAFGFHDVQITGHRWTGCGDRDDTSTGFTALNSEGRYVSGVVCSQTGIFGWGKSSTVRID